MNFITSKSFPQAIQDLIAQNKYSLTVFFFNFHEGDGLPDKHSQQAWKDKFHETYEYEEGGGVEEYFLEIDNTLFFIQYLAADYPSLPSLHSEGSTDNLLQCIEECSDIWVTQNMGLAYFIEQQLSNYCQI